MSYGHRKPVPQLLEEIWYMILSDFDGDEEAASEWIVKPLRILGGLSPQQMVHTGQVEKLHRVIEQAVGWPEGELDA